MSATDDDALLARELTEVENLYANRYLGLLGLGMPPDHAFALLDQADIVHIVQALIAKGCPPELVFALNFEE